MLMKQNNWKAWLATETPMFCHVPNTLIAIYSYMVYAIFILYHLVFSYNSFPLVYLFIVHIVYFHDCTIILRLIWFDIKKIEYSLNITNIKYKVGEGCLWLLEHFLKPSDKW